MCDALARQNADIPGGLLSGPEHEQTLRTMGRYADPKSFDDPVIATRNGAPIRVRDIDRAENGTESPDCGDRRGAPP